MQCPFTAVRVNTHLECTKPLRDCVRPHLGVIDFETSPFVVSTDVSSACTLVESLVDVLGSQPQFAELARQRLGWFEHGRDAIRGVRTWPGLAVYWRRLRRWFNTSFRLPIRWQSGEIRRVLVSGLVRRQCRCNLSQTCPRSTLKLKLKFG